MISLGRAGVLPYDGGQAYVAQMGGVSCFPLYGHLDHMHPGFNFVSKNVLEKYSIEMGNNFWNDLKILCGTLLSLCYSPTRCFTCGMKLFT